MRKEGVGGDIWNYRWLWGITWVWELNKFLYYMYFAFVCVCVFIYLVTLIMFISYYCYLCSSLSYMPSLCVIIYSNPLGLISAA